jgi:aryl-alcohol dehydrogenase-like predicted oxidoreductase
MSCYNPSYQDELPVLQAAAQQQRGILVKKAFASGHLDQLQIAHSIPHSNLPKTDNPIEAALQFIFLQQGVSSIILGTINPEHLCENVQLTEKILCQLGD